MAHVAYADSWAPPTLLGKASESGRYVVRVTPGTSKGDVVGFAGEKRGPYAKAEWHRYEGNGYKRIRVATLLNPVAPEVIEVTEKGNLITADNWHNRGYGYVLAIYTPKGDVLKQYRLTDLYAESDIKRMRTMTSSIHWRCEGFSIVLDSPTKLWIDDSIGGRFVVDVNSGLFEYEREGGSCKN
jgi:hypothetical protein